MSIVATLTAPWMTIGRIIRRIRSIPEDISDRALDSSGTVISLSMTRNRKMEVRKGVGKFRRP